MKYISSIYYNYNLYKNQTFIIHVHIFDHFCLKKNNGGCKMFRWFYSVLKQAMKWKTRIKQSHLNCWSDTSCWKRWAVKLVNWTFNNAKSFCCFIVELSFRWTQKSMQNNVVVRFQYYLKIFSQQVEIFCLNGKFSKG